MIRLRHILLAGGLACGLAAAVPVARAQAAGAAPAPAPWGLFSARYDTRTSAFIYALYGYGQSFAMVGTLQNPRSKWTELVAAVGRTFTTGADGSHAVALGVAHATEDWYAQLYVVPAFRVAHAWVRGTAELDVPLGRVGVTQFALSPVSITAPVARHVELGLSTDLASARGARSTIAIGPEARVALPSATIGADLQRMTDGHASRARLFFLTQF